MKIKLFIQQKAYLLVAIILLTLGFYTNLFHVTSQDKFNSFERYSESLVIGRLIAAEKEGLFSYGGLTGRIKDIPKDKDLKAYQYEIYENDLNVNTKVFSGYYSQTGGQAISFALLGKVLPFNNRIKLEIFWLVTSLLTATAFSIFLYWVKQEFGLNVFIVCLVSMLLSRHITVFGKNIWWSLWSFYIPFLALLIRLLYESRENRGSFIKLHYLFGLSFITVLLKCFFTGFEYITTTLIMFVTPTIFYALLNRWSLKTFILRNITLATGAVSAIVTSFIILAYQVSFIRGSFQAGLDHIMFSFFKRTSGYSDDIPAVYKNSLEANVFKVVGLNMLKNMMVGLNMVVIIAVFTLLSITLFAKKDTFPNCYQNRSRKTFALVATTWVSILAPLSWLIIFKGHSYIHSHMNPIVWYMPFCLFGFTMIGYIFPSLYKDIKLGLKKRRKVNS